MKKFVFLILMCVSYLAIGQDKNFTSFGFKAGLNRSIINGYELNGAKTGYVGVELYAGFFADTNFKNGWHFESELLYSFSDDYHFIEIPLHVKYQIYNKTLLFLGPKLDLIGEQGEQNYNFINPGVSIEAGIQYELLKRILIEFRYAQGLRKQINDVSFDIYDGKRNTFRLGIGILF